MILTEDSIKLQQKWSPILENKDLGIITDPWKKNVVAQMLENQSLLSEATATTTTGNAQSYDPVLISMVRRASPHMIAFDLCGVQPMTMPTGLVFALRAKYTDKNGSEALFNEADSSFSGSPVAGAVGGVTPVAVKVKTAQSGVGTAIVVTSTVGLTAGMVLSGVGVAEGTKIVSIATDTLTVSLATTQALALGAILGVSPVVGHGMLTSTAEGDVNGEMSMTIEKVSVTAQSRQLKAGYSIELAQDLQSAHGLDADSELSAILSTEILTELNREVIRTLYSTAKIGATSGTANVGVFDLTSDSDGRWSAERFKGLVYRIEKEASAIAIETRRGKANKMVTSPDVASALAMAGVLSDGKLGTAELNSDFTYNTYVGRLNGRIDVYVDPYATTNFVLLGYKGNSASDAGVFYCPYQPLQLFRATDPNSFTPRMAFKSRYGMVANPFANTDGKLTARANPYYRVFAVTGL